MLSRTKLLVFSTLTVMTLANCSSSSNETGAAGKGGNAGSSGGGNAGTSSTVSGGGAAGSAGTSSTSSGSGGSAGSSGSGGKSGAGGGSAGTGGKADAGERLDAGTDTGSEAGPGRPDGNGTDRGGPGGGSGDAGPGARDAGGKDTSEGSEAGSGGDFQPCPTNGDPCKVLPLGDSITWGINYGGGYRIKLFAHTVTDQKNITFVGYDTANPPDTATLNKLGSASSKFVNKHEGHSGWTIQQDDDLVTGKSTATNDSVSYKGKKVVADFGPHIVLVHLGTNDMYQTPTGAPDRLGAIIDHIVADAPNALVVVSSIIPFPQGASAVTTFNKAVPGVVKQRTDAGKHVIYVDQFTGFSTSDLGSDQVHPNEGGYEKMAVVWYNAIKQYLH